MTEDDTFNMLRRKPISQVYKEFRDSSTGFTGVRILYEYLIENRWTLREYLLYHYSLYPLETDDLEKYIDEAMVRFRDIAERIYGFQLNE